MSRYSQVTRRDERTKGERISDAVTNFYGSWRFIILQSLIIIFWIIYNTAVSQLAFDRPPFIGLNLLLSLEAAFSAAFILMSQNRLAEMDRRIFNHTDAEVMKIRTKVNKLEKDILNE